MDTMLAAMLPFIVLAVVLCCRARRVTCPDCGDPLPRLVSPFKKTRRMWRAGGYLCGRCGCETNLAGEKVTADTPPAPFPTVQCVVLGAALLLGLGLGAGMVLGRPTVKASPFEHPQQAPAAAHADSQ